MRAMLLLVLLLALIALFSFHGPLIPFWKDRLPAVMGCLDEGRYRDAWEAATAGDAPGTKSNRWAKSEPLGEAAPASESPDGEAAPAEKPVGDESERAAPDSMPREIDAPAPE